MENYGIDLCPLLVSFLSRFWAESSKRQFQFLGPWSKFIIMVKMVIMVEMVIIIKMVNAVKLVIVVISQGGQ